MQEYVIRYECPACQHQWHEIWSCACDSECPACGLRAIQAADYEEISSTAEDTHD